MDNILMGLVLSFVIALGAYKKGSLTLSGFLSAGLLGTTIYFAGGFFFFIIMGGFFLSSSLLTKYKCKVKDDIEKIHEKTGARDYIQVAANGLPAMIFALLYYFTLNQIFMLAYAVSLAACNADTWASELGVLSKKKPVSIITRKPVEKGISGGVSFLGIVTSFFGALFIAVIFWLGYISIFGFSSKAIIFLILIIIGGFLGSIIDSIMGDILQAKYCCNITNCITEKKYSENKKNKLIKGFGCIDNDFVNFLSSILSAGIVILLYTISNTL